MNSKVKKEDEYLVFRSFIDRLRASNLTGFGMIVERMGEHKQDFMNILQTMRIQIDDSTTEARKIVKILRIKR